MYAAAATNDHEEAMVALGVFAFLLLILSFVSSNPDQRS
jgi:hypothetical protein